jgi:hypothetical protein
MTTASPRVIGNLGAGQRSSTIANLNMNTYCTVLQHLQDVAAGNKQRSLPDGYVGNLRCPRIAALARLGARN